MLSEKSSLKLNIKFLSIIKIVRRGFCGCFFVFFFGGGGRPATHSKPPNGEKEGIKKGEKEKRGSGEKPVFPC